MLIIIIIIFTFHLCVQTFLGDFQKEQEKFVQEKKSKRSGRV